jgi:hypothetical protein
MFHIYGNFTPCIEPFQSFQSFQLIGRGFSLVLWPEDGYPYRQMAADAVGALTRLFA